MRSAWRLRMDDHRNERRRYPDRSARLRHLGVRRTRAHHPGKTASGRFTSRRRREPGGGMRLLLTSDGITNAGIREALVGLLGKPIAASNALCVPTASYATGGPGPAWRLITGQADTPLCELGWRSLGVLELTALPSLDEEQWLPWVEETDALLVGGGDALYLCHWMRHSGLADIWPSLDTVYVGVSGGSMVMTPNIGPEYIGWKPP